jgi:hypothetical protein
MDAQERAKMIEAVKNSTKPIKKIDVAGAAYPNKKAASVPACQASVVKQEALPDKQETIQPGQTIQQTARTMQRNSAWMGTYCEAIEDRKTWRELAQSTQQITLDGVVFPSGREFLHLVASNAIEPYTKLKAKLALEIVSAKEPELALEMVNN